jgi:hypothetical protein
VRCAANGREHYSASTLTGAKAGAVSSSSSSSTRPGSASCSTLHLSLNPGNHLDIAARLVSTKHSPACIFCCPSPNPLSLGGGFGFRSNLQWLRKRVQGRAGAPDRAAATVPFGGRDALGHIGLPLFLSLAQALLARKSRFRTSLTTLYLLIDFHRPSGTTHTHPEGRTPANTAPPLEPCGLAVELHWGCVR